MADRAGCPGHGGPDGCAAERLPRRFAPRADGPLLGGAAVSRILTAVLAVAAVCCVASLAKADGAPSRVTDLAITIMGKTTAVLTFTDSGDDCMDGTAASYEVRYSTSPITAANFGSAS